jgi:hypothetical protein
MPAGAVPGRSWVSGNIRGTVPQGGGKRLFPRLAGTLRPALPAAAALLIAVGCGDSPHTVPEAQPYLDPGFVESGEHRLHYALTLARDLPSAIAGSYGIEQRRNLAVLTISIVPVDGRAAPGSISPRVEAEAISLTGARQRLEVARHDEAVGSTWLASVDVAHRVPLTIEIRARATSDGPLLRARLTREFRLD